MGEMHRVFILGGPQSSGGEGNLRDFPGGVIITPEPTETKYVSGAWNYAVRKTSTGFLTVNYEAAINFLREKHPDWIIVYPDKPRQIWFREGSVDLQHYTPPDED